MKKLIPKDNVLLPDTAELKFKGEVFDTYQWPQVVFDGTTHTFEMLKRDDTVNAMCVVDGKILVLDEEQPHLGARQNFAGGRVDPEDDSVLAAVQREVLEETGYRFANWRLVRVWQPYRKMEWFVHNWIAWDVIDSQAPHIDAGEKITVKQLGFDELKQLVLNDDDYLGDSAPIFRSISSVDELLALPEFEGQEIDR